MIKILYFHNRSVFILKFSIINIIWTFNFLWLRMSKCLCVDHGRSDVTMAQQFLHRPNIVSCFEQMGGKTMSESMRCGFFGNLSFYSSRFNSLLSLLNLLFFLIFLFEFFFIQRQTVV
jgi:hypothetical protein